AVVAANADDKAAAVLDAARATALLDDEDESPLDRCVGYVVAAAAFNTLRLWELVDDLYDRALQFGPAADETRQTAAIVVNRVLTRLEWALAAVEHGDVERRDVERRDVEHGDTGDSDAELADQLLDAVLDAVPAALATELPTLWRLNVLACADVASLLRGFDVDAILGRVDEHRRSLTDAGDLEVLPSLEAATAVVLWRCGRRDAAVEAAMRAMPATSATSGAATFPLWARAHVLARSEPSAATAAQLDHSRAVVRMLWQSRRTVLAAARAQILIEQRKHEHVALTHAVNTDALTGLFNRRRFEFWLQQPVSELRPCTALLLIDVDDFKEVNDSFGHDCGDEVLRRVASMMASAVRPDDVAIRHGGDEFALLLDGDDLQASAVTELAERLSAAISGASWASVAPELTISVTIGAALSHRSGKRPGVDPVALYKLADAALYRAKRSGSRIELSEV
ncbi:MAG: diguanylate cyclase domain-containing protein, partial [Acidothermaceae bacterium]